MSRSSRPLAEPDNHPYLTIVLPWEFALSTRRSDRLTTTVSTKGQVILPKAIRDKRRWNNGTRLVVQDTPAGVLLTSEPLFPPTRVEDVFGMLKYDGPPKTIKEMEEAVAEMFGREYARD